jgi:hypothetical protein
MRLALVGIVGLFAIFAAPALAVTTREGVLKEEVSDNFADASSTTTYELKAAGATTPLLPTDLSTATADEKVVASGTMQDGKLVGAVTGVAPQTVAVPAAGPRKVAVLLIKFPGDAAEPWSPNVVREQRVFTASNSANAFYQEETYGRISLVGKQNPNGDVFGWFTLATPVGSCPYLTWRTEAKAAAEAAGISLAGYDHIIYVNDPQSSCTSNGIGEIGGTQVNVFGNLATKTYAHELGHNLGLHHASSETCTTGGVRVQIGDSCTISEYGDIFDVMGIPNTRHNNSVGLEELGVLAPENIRTVTANGIYSIKAALSPSLGPTTLRIPHTKDSNGNVTSWYYLEIREKGGVFENVSDATMTGVSIRIAPVPASSARTILLDMNPATATFNDAPLSEGETFDDGAVRVQTMSAAAGSATVAIVVSPDSTPPSAPTGLSASQAPSGSVALTWSPSPDFDVAKYVVFRDGVELGASPGPSFVDANPLLGLHAYVVYAEDVTGNRSSASIAKTLTVADVTPPSVPVGLSGEQAPSGGVALTWAASADNVGVARYVVFRDGGELGASVGTSFIDPQPAPGPHAYVVYAEDAAGNRSSASHSKAVTVSDLKAPSAPTQLSGIQTLQGVALAWAPSTDNVGVVKYAIFRDGVEVGTSASTSFIDANPSLGLHTYVVYAMDAAGNRSAASASKGVTVVDLAPPKAPALLPGGSPSPTRPAPRLSWHRRADGQFRFEVDATKDPVAVRVGLWVDGRRLRARAGKILMAIWDPAEARGCADIHGVAARAYDAAGEATVTTARVRAIAPARFSPKCRSRSAALIWSALIS